MLLNNKSRLCFYAEIDLTFDDETNKKAIFRVGDTIRLSFRRNGVKLTKQGVIKNIYPSRIVESQLYGTKKLSAVLDLDCSTNYRSFSYKIDISDILDILPVEEKPEQPSNPDDDGYWNDLGELVEDNTNNDEDKKEDDDYWNDLEELIK